jgi:nucleotide-binding universal stress UspA family protein
MSKSLDRHETMFNTILVPIDPSRPFGAANDYACALAKRFGSKVIANYIVDEAIVSGAGEAATALDDALECIGLDAMDRFVVAHPELQVKKLLSYGPTATVIFQSVLSTGAGVVVVGGYSGASHPSFWGSTVMDIVKHDERPTFVVRAPARLPNEGDSIIVPFDGSKAAQQVLPQITKFARTLGLTVDLVKVAKKKDSDRALRALQLGAALIEGDGIACTTHCIEATRFSGIGRSILKFARQQRTPLIAMSRLGASSTITGQSRTLGWLLAHSDIPVWVVRR